MGVTFNRGFSKAVLSDKKTSLLTGFFEIKKSE